MLARIWRIIVKEFIHFRRDRLLTSFLFFFPVLQLLLIANATAGQFANLPVAFLDGDNSRVSRGIAQALNNTEALALYYYPASMGELERLLDQGQALLAIVVPPGFAADLSNPAAQARLQIIGDGSNISAGTTGLRTAEGAITSYLLRFLADNGRIDAAGLTEPPLALQTAIRFNPQLDNHYASIPGLFSFIVYQVAMVVAALSLVRERELGTLEQLTVTPVRRSELLIGKTIPAVVVTMIDFAVMFVIIVYVFHIPMRGSWPLIFLLSALFITTVAGWGALISVLARTQQQATLIIFPIAIIDLSLSGYLAPVENMAIGLQALSLISPLRHYMAILRDVMLKGADLTTLWPNALALAVLAIGVTLLSHRNVARRFE